MNSYKTERFNICLANLPEAVRADARAAFRLFMQDPFDPRLHFKRLRGKPDTWSVRINNDGYRALGIRDGEDIEWYWAGSHADYDRLIG